MAAEFVAGETLRQCMSRARMEPKIALDVSAQIAGALVAAHDAGLVHRDIKPENIMLRPDGYVKVLDFGLAKLVEAPRSTATTALPTAIKAITETGMVLGTASYMSPEQARGEDVDGRTDLFSLGVVLYEMLAGEPPFAGGSTADIIAAVVSQEPPPLAQAAPDIPEAVQWVIVKALRKDRDERYQTAKELLSDLKNLKSSMEFQQALERSVSSGQTAPAVATSRRSWNRWIVGIAVIVTLAVALVLWFLVVRPGTETGRPTPFSSATFTQVTFQPGPEYFPSLSPDGKSVVYASRASGNWDIYLLRVGGRNPTNLTKDSPADDTQPAFSPDGEHIAFRSDREGGGIYLMGATGESVIRLSDYGYNPSWSPDGQELVFATEKVTQPSIRPTRSQLWKVNLKNGHKRLLSEGDALQPAWSPGGHRIAYWSRPSSTGQGKRLAYSGQEEVRNLKKVAFDPSTGRVRGDPISITRGSMELWFPDTSPDGAWLACNSMGNQRHIFVLRSDGSGLRDLTDDDSRNYWPRWSPDGKRIAFSSRRTGSWELWMINRDGSGLQQLTQASGAHYAPWSADGRFIAYSIHTPRNDCVIFEPAKPWSEQTLQHLAPVSDPTVGFEAWSWSPDGRKLSGIRHLVDGAHAGIGAYDLQANKHDWLTDFGDWPIWLNDGRRILFVSQGKLFVIDTKSRKYQPVLTVSDGDLDIGSPTLSKDNRTIYFTYTAAEADIWVLNVD